MELQDATAMAIALAPASPISAENRFRAFKQQAGWARAFATAAAPSSPKGLQPIVSERSERLCDALIAPAIASAPTLPTPFLERLKESSVRLRAIPLESDWAPTSPSRLVEMSSDVSEELSIQRDSSTQHAPVRSLQLTSTLRTVRLLITALAKRTAPLSRKPHDPRSICDRTGHSPTSSRNGIG